MGLFSPAAMCQCNSKAWREMVAYIFNMIWNIALGIYNLWAGIKFKIRIRRREWDDRKIRKRWIKRNKRYQKEMSRFHEEVAPTLVQDSQDSFIHFDKYILNEENSHHSTKVGLMCRNIH